MLLDNLYWQETERDGDGRTCGHSNKEFWKLIIMEENMFVKVSSVCLHGDQNWFTLQVSFFFWSPLFFFFFNPLMLHSLECCLTPHTNPIDLCRPYGRKSPCFPQSKEVKMGHCLKRIDWLDHMFFVFFLFSLWTKRWDALIKTFTTGSFGE